MRDMNNKKYYTPEIEEFHVGFEFQIGLFEKWEKRVFTFQTSLSMISDFKDKFRVKYLDQKDIEDLGWKYSGLENKYYILNKDTGLIDLWLEWIGQFVKITDCRVKPDRLVFDGTIKNKSEFKKIIAQVII